MNSIAIVKKTTIWIYYYSNPLQSVWIDENASDQQVIDKALQDLDSVPGCICNLYEAPYERRSKLTHGGIEILRGQEKSFYR